MYFLESFLKKLLKIFIVTLNLAEPVYIHCFKMQRLDRNMNVELIDHRAIAVNIAL